MLIGLKILFYGPEYVEILVEPESSPEKNIIGNVSMFLNQNKYLEHDYQFWTNMKF